MRRAGPGRSALNCEAGSPAVGPAVGHGLAVPVQTTFRRPGRRCHSCQVAVVAVVRGDDAVGRNAGVRLTAQRPWRLASARTVDAGISRIRASISARTAIVAISLEIRADVQGRALDRAARVVAVGSVVDALRACLAAVDGAIVDAGASATVRTTRNQRLFRSWGVQPPSGEVRPPST